MSEPREWLIRKGGMYYRPDRAGYTSSPAEAGRYTLAEALREVEIEPWNMTAIHQSDAAKLGPNKLPADVVRLVIAAREVAYTDAPDPKEREELDRAVEAFAERVPWDDEPDL